MNPPSYVQTDTVLTWLQTGNRNVLIVDVRDADREGGHIRGSLHLPSSTFLAKVDEVLKPILEEKDSSSMTLVVHCMHSQIRGPKAARTLKTLYPSHEIMILEGGFYRFQAVCKTKQLIGTFIDDYDQEAWDSGWMQ